MSDLNSNKVQKKYEQKKINKQSFLNAAFD